MADEEEETVEAEPEKKDATTTIITTSTEIRREKDDITVLFPMHKESGRLVLLQWDCDCYNRSGT